MSEGKKRRKRPVSCSTWNQAFRRGFALWRCWIASVVCGGLAIETRANGIMQVEWTYGRRRFAIFLVVAI